MSVALNVILKAQDQLSGPVKQATGSLDELDRGAKRAEGGVSMLKTAIGTMAGMLARDAVLALGNLAKSVISTGINFNAMSEQATIAFSTMLGSGQEAEKFLKDLQQFAAKTPFEFPELVQAAQKMLAFGFEAKQVKPLLSAVGDAVAAVGGNSQQVDRVTTALGQMQAKQKVSAEEMMQLTEAGIPAWEILATKIGVSVPEAMEMATKGSIKSATAIDALVAGMTERFGGMMDQQSRTWSGYLSTIRDTFAQLAGKVMTPLFDYLKDWMPWVIARMDSLLGAWDRLFKVWGHGLTLSGALKTALYEMLPPGLYAAVEKVINVFSRWWKDVLIVLAAFITSALVPVLAGLVAGIVSLLAPVAAVVAAVHGLRLAWESDWGGVRSFFEDLWGRVRPIFEALKNTITQFGTESLREIWAFVQGNDTSFVAVQAIWQRLKDAGYQLKDEIARAFSGMVESIRARMPDWVEQIGKWGAEAWTWLAVVAIPKVREQIRVWWEMLRDYVTTNLPAWKDKLKLWATSAWDWLTTEAIPMARAKITEWWIMLRDYVTTNWPTWKARMQEWGDAMWQEFAERFPNAAAKVTDAMTKLKQEWGPWVDYFLNKNGELQRDWDDLKKTWNDFIQDIKDTIKPVQPYIDEFKRAWDNLKSAIDNLKRTWTEAFGEGGTGAQLKSWGQIVGQVINLSVEFIAINLIGAVKLLTAAVQLLSGDWKGAWNSIKSAATDVGGFVIGIVNTIIDVLNKLTGGALSRLWQAGSDLIQGLWDGIRKKWYDLTSWFSGVWGDLVDSFKRFFGIASPSTLFEQYGMSMMEGWQQGIAAGSEGVTRAMESVAQSVSTQAAGITARVQQLSSGLQDQFQAMMDVAASLGNTDAAGMIADVLVGRSADQASTAEWIRQRDIAARQLAFDAQFAPPAANTQPTATLMPVGTTFTSWNGKTYRQTSTGIEGVAAATSIWTSQLADLVNQLRSTFVPILNQESGWLQGLGGPTAEAMNDIWNMSATNLRSSNTAYAQGYENRLVDAIMMLVGAIQGKGLGNQYNVQMLATGGTDAEQITNLVAYLQALYG